MKLKKHKCCECGEYATWKNIRAKIGDPIFYCEKCVPKSAEYFSHSSDGFKRRFSESTFLLSYTSILNCFKKCFKESRFTNRDRFAMIDYIGDLFLKKREKGQYAFINYNVFMCDFGDHIHNIIKYGKFHGKEEELFKFYTFFKQEIKKTKIIA